MGRGPVPSDVEEEEGRVDPGVEETGDNDEVVDEDVETREG